MAGSAVDAMLKTIGYKKGSLYDRIDEALKNNVLTKGMADWAHEVRLGSNRPRHADKDAPHVKPSEAQPRGRGPTNFFKNDIMNCWPIWNHLRESEAWTSELSAKLFTLAADEPMAMRPLDALAYNKALDASHPPEDTNQYRLYVPLLQRRLRHVFAFKGTAYGLQKDRKPSWFSRLRARLSV